MRLWTIHPGYLDAKGLVAVWREGLLAQKVLEGKTKGYTRHPQLIRFRETDEPIARIDFYLAAILREAASRGYHFNESAIGTIEAPLPGRQIPVTVRQVEYEAELLIWKLERRDPTRIGNIRTANPIKLNETFILHDGDVESWERTIPEILERLRTTGTKQSNTP